LVGLPGGNSLAKNIVMNALRSHRVEPTVLPQLTVKQREVMMLVADNRTSKEIAGLLGISESAVNQRIEIIRSRLGGLPRGEMARLYRQEFAREQTLAATYPPIWKKIQVQSAAEQDQSTGAEGRPGDATAGLQQGSREPGVGSQPSHSLLPAVPIRRGREELYSKLLHMLLVTLLIVAGISTAAIVTQAVGMTLGG
jgi:DNA-binding CsgD family transcriptional regulator